jgi:TonB-dependent receptor
MVRSSAIVAAAVAFVVTAVARAQQVGSLRGTASDKDFGSPIAGVLVQLVETGQKVESTDQGTFVFPQVRPGKYTLVASKDGYLRVVRPDVLVDPGQLAEVRLELAGDFTELEEFVVQDSLQLGSGTELALLDIRTESAALMDSVSTDLMSKAGASDAAAGLRLVAGASTQNGKSAVIRGLPDRYVSSQINGVLLPSSDKDKRQVELDQIPADVIQSLQVSKTFTPDQQGNASGGAVNVVLKGVPDEPLFLRWKVSTAYNSQYTGRGDFLTYGDGGVRTFGKKGRDRSVQPLGENWDGAVGVSSESAPLEFKGALSGGFSFDVGKGWRAGGFFNAFYDRDNQAFEGVDDSYWALRAGDPLSPQYNQGIPGSGEFNTALFDIRQTRQSAQWGGLSTFGIQNDNHAINIAWLRTQTAEDTTTLAEDTRGKAYFYPGYNPGDPGSPGYDEILGAPWLRLQTLSYVERTTETLQLTGRHRLPLYAKKHAELDWTLAQSGAERDQPDRRQFAAAWIPNASLPSGASVPRYQQYKPAAQALLGNLQRIYEHIDETSEEIVGNLKIPFDIWGKREAFLKIGGFRDDVERSFNQDTYSNFGQPSSSYQGEWDEIDWSQVWAFQSQPISDGRDFSGQVDVDYEGDQVITASYAMLDLPLVERMRLVFGARYETTRIRIVNTPEENAVWIPPGNFGTAIFLPGAADVDFAQYDLLPAAALSYDLVDGLTLRAAYSETIARQTFKELTPVFQQEFLGGPVFVGNPELDMSSLRNMDLRADWSPYDGGLLSASWFHKDVVNPIEYVEKLGTYTFTTAVNFPRGTLKGIELETRQSLGHFWGPLEGFGLGANGTWLEHSVRLPEAELLAFEELQGFRQAPTRDMTNAPDYLYNLYATYDVPWTGTSLGIFYNVTGDTLIQGPGPSESFFVPATYETRYETLNASLMQPLGRGVRLTIGARNLTNALRRQVYRSEFIDDDVTRRTFTEGVEWSITVGGEITF